MSLKDDSLTFWLDCVKNTCDIFPFPCISELDPPFPNPGGITNRSEGSLFFTIVKTENAYWTVI